nr:MAG TPA: hypothetical protein [Caudoviricetes sp.]
MEVINYIVLVILKLTVLFLKSTFFHKFIV